VILTRIVYNRGKRSTKTWVLRASTFRTWWRICRHPFLCQLYQRSQQPNQTLSRRSTAATTSRHTSITIFKRSSFKSSRLSILKEAVIALLQQLTVLNRTQDRDTMEIWLFAKAKTKRLINCVTLCLCSSLRMESWAAVRIATATKRRMSSKSLIRAVQCIQDWAHVPKTSQERTCIYRAPFLN